MVTMKRFMDIWFVWILLLILQVGIYAGLFGILVTCMDDRAVSDLAIYLATLILVIMISFSSVFMVKWFEILNHEVKWL